MTKNQDILEKGWVFVITTLSKIIKTFKYDYFNESIKIKTI
jgi:hypothetical protein